jgi:hypothetical protein
MLQCSAVLGANRWLMMQMKLFCCCCSTKQSTAIFRLHEASARFDMLFCLLSLCLLIFKHLLREKNDLFCFHMVDLRTARMTSLLNQNVLEMIL